MHPDGFTDQVELHDYAERNGLVYTWEYTRAFAKWQRLLSRSMRDYTGGAPFVT